MQAKRKLALQQLLQRCRLNIAHWELLDIALIHPTYEFEHRDQVAGNNQRLEFVGDAVLGMIVAEHLYQKFPDFTEGQLSKMRAVLVCEPMLASKARELDLGQYLLLGRGEDLSGGRDRNSILADAFEALVGALYLGEGVEVARSFVLGQFSREMEQCSTNGYGDYKTMLQEEVQKRGEDNVAYVILKESGPDHDKRFVAGVTYRDRLLATGSGRSKKEAEQIAAREALASIDRWVSK